jgi:hypothetical protein
MPGWARIDLEKSRLEAGKGPYDDLVGLEGWEIVDMQKERHKYGY